MKFFEVVTAENGRHRIYILGFRILSFRFGGGGKIHTLNNTKSYLIDDFKD